MHDNGLLSSARIISQDTLNRANDQLSRRLTMAIKARDAHIEFHLD